MDISENYRWNILKEYFDKNGFIKHQLDTFNDYLNCGIQRVVEETDILINQKDFKYHVKFGDVYIPEPIIIEEDRKVRKLYPSEARIRDLTYDSPIFVDIIETLEMDGQEPEINVYKRRVIGRTPIMLNSDKCNLSSHSNIEKVKKGECEWDKGGYFIIRGKERVLVGQLRGVYNQPIIMAQKPGEKYKFVCDVRSMSEETGHSVLIQSKIGVDDRSIVFSLHCIKEPIPVGIVFKALGFVDENEIVKLIDNNNPEVQKYIKYILRDSYFIKTQADACRYIGKYAMYIIKEDKHEEYGSQVVENEILPHMGITSTIKEKAMFLANMVSKLLNTHVGLRVEDDRDNYCNKRVEMAGVLCCELFRTLFKRFVKKIKDDLEKKKQRPDILTIISRTTSISMGLKYSFSTGNWGVQKNSYMRTGVSQVLSRMTYGGTLSHLRRIVIPIGKEGKNSKIRQPHASQIMFICPNECFDPETPILTWDRNVKLAKDIKVGDILIDDKGYPTRVKSTISGIAPMYEVNTDKSNFLNYTVTSNHILTLKVNKFHEDIKKYDIQIDENDVIDINIDKFKKLPEFIQTSLSIFKCKNPLITKDNSETEFKLNEKGMGNFVGWQVEGNGRFLLSDFSVTHNTPEGQSIGIVMNLALLTSVTTRIPTVLIKEIIENSKNFIFIDDTSFDDEISYTKIFINGILSGVCKDYKEMLNELHEYQVTGLLDRQISFSYQKVDNEIKIFSDEGRFIRPILTVNKDNKLNLTEDQEINWNKFIENGQIKYIDHTEAENSVIAMDENDMKKFKVDYCEICPAMMMGVMSNNIPFPDHSQCIFKDEPVYMANGTVKKISDVEVGDKVITFDPKTQKQTITTVTHTETHPTLKKLFTITTVSGRQITATFDHRFMTSEGWKRLEKLKEHETLIGISLEQKPLTHIVKEEIVILDNKKLELEIPINKILPLTNSNPYLPILARIFGYTFNNIIRQNDERNYEMVIKFNNVNDMEMFDSDLKELGLPFVKLILTKEKVLYEGVLVEILHLLRNDNNTRYGNYGFKKFTIPEWIMNGTDVVKREFLASFHRDIFTHYGFSEVESVSNGIHQLYGDLKDKNIVTYDKYYSELSCYDLVSDCENIQLNEKQKNFIQFYENVGYRYDYNKIIDIGTKVEYLKYINYSRNNGVMNLQDFNTWKNHLKISSITLFMHISTIIESRENIISDITVDSDENQSFLCGDTFCVHNSPRNIYQSSMGKQAVGMFALSHQVRTDTIVHVLDYPQRALVSTIPSKFMGFDDMPSGINAIVAIMCYSGFNW